ncbi:MAG: CPBP family intramembrane glutamic endopeptidase [Candidatus Spyradocola sp.]|jgi:membrane protease YdiL (CAAX protease family)
MTNAAEKRAPMGTLRALLAVLLALAALVAAQALALLLGEVLLGAGVPGPACNVLTAALYALLALGGVALLCRFVLRIPLAALRIGRLWIHPVWVLAAFALPTLVLAGALLAGGRWEIYRFDSQTVWLMVTGGVFYYGLAAGIVEEMVFRGVILGCLERRWNQKIAILVPSVLFGLVHLIDAPLDPLSAVQLLTAGTIVGVLFSLITCQSGSVWNSALVHGVWNAAILGGILHIGSAPDSASMYNFVLSGASFLLSGGDFGIEASILAIVPYLLGILLAVFLLHQGKKEGMA